MAGDPRRKGPKKGGAKPGKPEAEIVAPETLVLLAPHGISAVTLASEPAFLAKVLGAQKMGRTPGQSTAALLSAIVRLRAEEIAQRKRLADRKKAEQDSKLMWARIGWTIVVLGTAAVLYMMFGNAPMIRRTWDYIFYAR